MTYNVFGGTLNPAQSNPMLQVQLPVTEARGDGVALATAGPYLDHLHFSPDR